MSIFFLTLILLDVIVLDMKKIFFVPILKTKCSAEPNAVALCKQFFSNRVIPYLEITNTSDNKGYIKIIDILQNQLHFEEIYRKKGSDINKILQETYTLIKPNCIVSLHILNQSELSNVFDECKFFINTCHHNNCPCAIRVFAGADSTQIGILLKLLKKKDFLIIDIGDSNLYSTKQYLDLVNSLSGCCRFLIFSNERPLSLTNSLLASDDYNPTFNTSVIEAIKKKDFEYDGFGSMCSAKNDLNEYPATKPTYAVFLLYDYFSNSFFSYKSDCKEHVSTAYSSLKVKITNDSSKVFSFTEKTAVAHNRLIELLNSNKKGNASTYICISIIHYIEEIINNIIKSND